MARPSDAYLYVGKNKSSLSKTTVEHQKRCLPRKEQQDFVFPPSPEMWETMSSPISNSSSNDWRHSLILDHYDRVRIFQFNVELVLEKSPAYAGALVYDEFEGKVKILRNIPGGGQAGSSFGEAHELALRSGCEHDLGVSFSLNLIHSASRAVAFRNKQHVVKNFLERTIWDGCPRLDTFHSIYLGAKDTFYNRTVIKRFLISAVARAFKPGSKVDTCLILEGPQGGFKSTFIKVLFMCPQWVNDTPLDLKSKDAYIGLQGKWAIELAELDSLSSADTGRVKAFLSIERDTFRAPYKRGTHEYPRSCVFVGTCNESAYLQDVTGGRRFWPLTVGNIDLNALVQDREQIWAEAVHYYKQGEPWHLTFEEEILAKEEQDNRRIEDPMEAPIGAYLATRPDTTIEEVLREALDMKAYRANSSYGRKVSQILGGVFGWERGKVVRGGARVNGYSRPLDE